MVVPVIILLASVLLGSCLMQRSASTEARVVLNAVQVKIGFKQPPC